MSTRQQSSVIKDFYFTCENCKKTHSFDEFQYSIMFTGLIVLVNNLNGYFGILCQECEKVTINNFPIEEMNAIWSYLNDPKGMIKIKPKDGIPFLYSKENLSTKILSYHSFSNYPNISVIPYFKSDEFFIHIFASNSIRDLNLQNIYSAIDMDENDFYISYLPDTTIDRGKVLIQGIKKEKIYEIIEIENLHQAKIIPRYYYWNNLQQRSNDYCFNNSCEYIWSPPEDEIEQNVYNPRERNIFEKIEFLKLIKEAGCFYDVVKQKDYKLIIHPQKKFDDKEENKLNLIGKNFRAGSYSTIWNDILKQIWDQFTDKNIDTILTMKAHKYRLAYKNEAEKINFSVFLIIALNKQFIDELEDSIINNTDEKDLGKSSKELSELAHKLDLEYSRLKMIISNDERINDIKINIVESYSNIDYSVLILGESGTGKELIANAIYETNKNLKGEFVKINCAALPETMLENELFGHKKGAFTGAHEDQEGKIEAANNGVLFLDEIGDLSLENQAKVLSVLEDKVVVRLGDSIKRKVNFRLICATNKNLKEEVEAKRFRNDLYHRINDLIIELPALRNRVDDDIKLLSEHFLKKYAHEHDCDKKISSMLMEKLISYSWPGNIRQLEKMIKRYSIQRKKKFIEIPDHEFDEPISEDRQKEELKSNHKLTLKEKKEYTDQNYITALKKSDGNRTKAAHELRVHPKTVFTRIRKMEKQGIKVPPPSK